MLINLKLHRFIVVFCTLVAIIVWFISGNFGGVPKGTSSGLSGIRIDDDNIMISVHAKDKFLENKAKGLTEENTKLFRSVLDDAGIDQEGMNYWLDTETWNIQGEKKP